ncbi:uncharacterized protein JCM6883_001758 [Sporobolomyces salmoneus]|uniref:uncharacterized protein n=1 Tax=Sporobolomyces salmoneus TaxID=183962 RepID=UPI0031814311
MPKRRKSSTPGSARPSSKELTKKIHAYRSSLSSMRQQLDDLELLENGGHKEVEREASGLRGAYQRTSDRLLAAEIELARRNDPLFPVPPSTSTSHPTSVHTREMSFATFSTPADTTYQISHFHHHPLPNHAESSANHPSNTSPSAFVPGRRSPRPSQPHVDPPRVWDFSHPLLASRNYEFFKYFAISGQDPSLGLEGGHYQGGGEERFNLVQLWCDEVLSCEQEITLAQDLLRCHGSSYVIETGRDSRPVTVEEYLVEMRTKLEEAHRRLRMAEREELRRGDGRNG